MSLRRAILKSSRSFSSSSSTATATATATQRRSISTISSLISDCSHLCRASRSLASTTSASTAEEEEGKEREIVQTNKARYANFDSFNLNSTHTRTMMFTTETTGSRSSSRSMMATTKARTVTTMTIRTHKERRQVRGYAFWSRGGGSGQDNDNNNNNNSNMNNDEPRTNTMTEVNTNTINDLQQEAKTEVVIADTISGSGNNSSLLESAFQSTSTDSITIMANSTNAEVFSEVAQIAGESWYTTASLMYVMEYFHVVSGLEWYQAIAAATILMRSLMLPFTVMQMRNTARMQLARPEMERIQERAKQMQLQNDPNAAQEQLKEVTAIWKKYDCHPVKSLAPLFISAPVFVSFYFAISRMADKIDSFKTGGAFWFPDLAASDPTLMMPLLTSALFLASVEFGAVEGMNNQQQGLTMKYMLRGLAVAMVPMTWNFTQGVFCYWITSNAYSLLQATLFKNAVMKRIVGIPDTSHLINLDSNTISQKMKLEQIHEKWGEKPTLHSSKPKKAASVGAKRYHSHSQSQIETHVAVRFLPSNALAEYTKND